MCTANRMAAMAPTPAARPSNPSSQFTVFIMPTIQKQVNMKTSTGPTDGQRCSSTTSPESGLVKRSMNTVALMAITAAPSWESSCGNQPRSRQSSSRPMGKRKAQPASTPIIRRASATFENGAAVYARALAAANPAKRATPPMRGRDCRWWWRERGLSTSTRSRGPMRAANAVPINATPPARANTCRESGISVRGVVHGPM